MLAVAIPYPRPVTDRDDDVSVVRLGNVHSSASCMPCQSAAVGQPDCPVPRPSTYPSTFHSTMFRVRTRLGRLDFETNHERTRVLSRHVEAGYQHPGIKIRVINQVCSSQRTNFCHHVVRPDDLLPERHLRRCRRLLRHIRRLCDVGAASSTLAPTRDRILLN